MKIIKNTNTLDGYLPALNYTEQKQEAEVMIVGGKKFDLLEYPKLKGIFKTGVGTDNLPFGQAKDLGVQIVLPSAATCDIIFEETAAFSCYLIMAGLYAGEGEWTTWKKDNRRMLQQKKLLVMGAGNIGQRVADKMKGLMNVTTFDTVKDAPETLEEKIRVADCISLHIPLMPQTQDFFNKERLGWLKDGALLVNTARGPVISETALYDELKTGRIKAALDVFWQEPYKGMLNEISPEYLIKTPHLASTCAEFLEGAAVDFLHFLDKLKTV